MRLQVSYEPGPEHDAGFSHLSRPGSAYVIRSQMPLTMTERERDPQMVILLNYTHCNF